MSNNWFGDDSDTPGTPLPGNGAQRADVRVEPAVVKPRPKGLLVQHLDDAGDFDWQQPQLRDAQSDDAAESDETQGDGQAAEDGRADSAFSESDFAQGQDAPEGADAGIELSRDEFYDGMSKVGNVVGAGGAVGIPHAGVAGAVLKGTAFAGKQVGKFFDSAADYADDAAHARHQNGDMKRFEAQKDQQALDKINKGIPKGGRVTKDD